MTEEFQKALELVAMEWQECWCKPSARYECPACLIRKELESVARKEGYVGQSFRVTDRS